MMTRILLCILSFYMCLPIQENLPMDCAVAVRSERLPSVSKTGGRLQYHFLSLVEIFPYSGPAKPLSVGCANCSSLSWKLDPPQFWKNKEAVIYVICLECIPCDHPRSVACSAPKQAPSRSFIWNSVPVPHDKFTLSIFMGRTYDCMQHMTSVW